MTLKTKYEETDLSQEFFNKMKTSTSNYSEVTCRSYNHNFRLLCHILSITTLEQLLQEILTGQPFIDKIEATDLTPSIR